jgi:hypothetical protein
MSLSIKSRELYEAMRDYTRAAMCLLIDEYAERPPRILKGLEEWRRDSDNLFRRHDREEPNWVDCIRTHQDRIHALSEYERLVAVVRSIPAICEQLETLVGTISQAQRIEIDHITDHLIWELAQLKNGFFFDESLFGELFEKFATDLGRTVFDYYSIGPLLGLNIEISPLPLESGIVLDWMTDDEIVRCLSIGFLRTWPRSLPLADIRSAVSVRVQYKLAKRIGDSNQTTIEPSLKVITHANHTAMDVLHALRVFKDGQISIPGLLQFSEQWPMEGGTGYQYMNPGPMPWFNKYNLSQRESEEFCTFWKQSREMTRHGAIANAVRRFSYASDRDRDDDRLVDLMIAAESLFLTDAGAAQERGELRYRLALRAAFFIDAPDSSRLSVFKHMKRAYDARSAIVHGGGEVDKNFLKSLNDSAISMKEFVQITRHLLRIAIKKRVEIAAAKGKPGIDWDALIIPSAT